MEASVGHNVKTGLYWYIWKGPEGFIQKTSICDQVFLVWWDTGLHRNEKRTTLDNDVTTWNNKGDCPVRKLNPLQEKKLSHLTIQAPLEKKKFLTITI